MAPKLHVLVSVLSVALAMGLSGDTTFGEQPHTLLLAQAKNAKVADSTPQQKLLYIAGVATVGVLICAIYASRGFVTVVSILSYVGALSSMSMLIKNAYVNAGFQYPQFLTCTHFFCTALVGSVVLLVRSGTGGKEVKVPTMECFLKGLLPVAAAFTLSLGFANMGLLLTNAHFYEMVGSSTALCTVGVGFVMGKSFDLRLMPPLGLITLSIVVIAFGEMKLSLLGTLALFGGVLARSIKSVVQSLLMSWNMDPIEVAVWTSSSCFVLMSIWSISTEGIAPWKAILAWAPFTAVLYTCAGAVTLNIAALFVLRELGPVAQQIVGNLKGVIAIVGSVCLMGEQVTMQQIVGYTFLVAGIFWYNRTDKQVKEEIQEKKQREADESTKIVKV